MMNLHQHPIAYAWPLGAAQAVTLGPAAHARSLWVHEGRLWLTRRVARGMADDVWLEAGQGLRMEAGEAWVAEAWPQAQLSVLPEPEPVPASVPAFSGGVSVWREAWRRLAMRRPRPGASSAPCAA
jgi:hypothetical protein